MAWHYSMQNISEMVEDGHTLSQKNVPSLTAIALTHINKFLLLAHVISRHSKIGYRYNFLNYLTFTYFILLWSEITTSATWSSESLLHGEALRRASSTRPLINGENDCARLKAKGTHYETSAVNNRFFSELPDHKIGSFQSHPQSTEENALHFTCLACGSLQGSVSCTYVLYF